MVPAVTRSQQNILVIAVGFSQSLNGRMCYFSICVRTGREQLQSFHESSSAMGHSTSRPSSFFELPSASRFVLHPVALDGVLRQNQEYVGFNCIARAWCSRYLVHVVPFDQRISYWFNSPVMPHPGT